MGSLPLSHQGSPYWSVLTGEHVLPGINGETVETVADFIFLAPKSLQMVTAAMKLKDAYSLEEKL